MLKRKTVSYILIQLIVLFIVSCSSQEYTTAKLAIQQSDFTKAAEWLPKAMEIEPNNPEIPLVLAIEIFAKNSEWSDMKKMFDRSMGIDPEKVIELRGSFLSVKEAVDNYTDFYWAKEFNSGVEQFKKIQDDPDNKPEYLETAISNVCNFACVMCNSGASSIIWGAYHKGVSVPKGFAESIDNLDEDLSELKLLKIVGGEPMIEKKHDNLLEMIVGQNKTPNELVIEYHTNASIFPSERIINQWKKINKVRIIFSMDSVEKYAKMQRPGNYEWQDIEDTVDKYIQLQHTGVPIIFSANITLTALNIESITETCDWLYNKLKDSKIDWFTCNTINKQAYKYIDFRNLSKQTKQRIKDKWKKWEDSNPPVMASEKRINKIYEIAKIYIDETGLLDTPLTEETMLENHHHRAIWKKYNVDLSTLNLLP